MLHHQQLSLTAPEFVEAKVIGSKEVGLCCIVAGCTAPFKRGEHVAVVRHAGQFGYRHLPQCPPKPLYARRPDG